MQFEFNLVPPGTPALLDIVSTAGVVGFSESQVRKWTYRQREVPHGWPTPLKIGDAVRYRRVDIEQWLAGLVVQQQSQSDSTPTPETQVGERTQAPQKRGRGRPRKIPVQTTRGAI